VTARDRDFLTAVATRVGGYLTNTRRGPGFCPVCSTPIDGGFPTCFSCSNHLATPNALLADQVASLAYGGHTPQSETLLHGYKKAVLSIGATENQHTQEQVLMAYLIHSTLSLHRSCIERTFGVLTHYAVVSSTSGRTDHPFPPLMTIVCGEVQSLESVAVEYVGPRPTPGQDEARQLKPDWYVVSDPSDVYGRHVLQLCRFFATHSRFRRPLCWSLSGLCPSNRFRTPGRRSPGMTHSIDIGSSHSLEKINWKPNRVLNPKYEGIPRPKNSAPPCAPSAQLEHPRP
jgi:hypothetical protein